MWFANPCFLASLAWGLASYKFDTYKKSAKQQPRLQLSDDLDRDSLQHYLDTIFLIRNF